MIYGLILAGGKGSRLYPLSRSNDPKQFLKLIDNKSFLVNTVERIMPLIDKNNIYAVTNCDYEEKIKNELANIIDINNVFTEPANKETATCIGLSAIKFLKKDANALMVVLPSDHYIKSEKKYIDTVKQAIDIADRRHCIVTLGIKPTRPETGYGYIEMGRQINGVLPTYKISRFTEKPNLEVAKDFILKEKYLWNSGMFIFRADVILREIQKYLPQLYTSLMNIYKCIGEENEKQIIEHNYNIIDGISIDFGVMQKTRKAYVIKCDFEWDDMGSFGALSRLLKEEKDNNISENVYIEKCQNCSIFGKENLIIGFGVKDLVIVDAGDVILVMDKNKDQEIKELLNNLGNKEQYKKFL